LGQKVNPVGLRLKIIKNWDSRWFSKKNYAASVVEDQKIRTFIKKRLSHAGISKIEIERAANKTKVRINSSRPGLIIGKKGADIENLRKDIEIFLKHPVAIDIVEVRRPEIDAILVGENIATQVEKRVSYKRAMKSAVLKAMKFGAQGIKICCSGRLSGAEIARREWYMEGRVPLHTLRADIDYGLSEAKTTYGIIGIKVWIFKGEILDDSQLTD
jgi:small subunit ribosomal protein S3